MYWLISQFPELDHLEPNQRAQLLARLPRQTYAMIIGRAAAGAFLLSAPFVVVIAVMSGAATVIGIPQWAIASIPIGVAIACGLYLNELNKLRNVMREVIAEAFRKERPPFCFKCGYDLRQASDTLCPECGVDWRASRVE